MTPAQCRAARALLNLSQKELAIYSGVSLRTVQGFEAGERELQSMALNTIARILNEKGVVFVTEPTKIGVLMAIPS